MKKSTANARSFYKNSMALSGTELREIARLVLDHAECEGVACFVNQTHSNGVTLTLNNKEGVRKSFVIREGQS